MLRAPYTKPIRSKLLTMKLKDYFGLLVSKTEQDEPKRARQILPELYEFIRALESVLERGDLNEILINETSIVYAAQKWLAKMDDEEEGDVEMADYFKTFGNKSRYTQPPKQLAETTNGEANGELVEKMAKLLFEDDILYPTLFRQEDTADKYLVAHCEFVDFSREMVNIKIDDDLLKVSTEK